jgi:hypothetical protein
MPQFGMLLTDDSRGIINDHKMFTIEAIGVESKKRGVNLLCLFVGWIILSRGKIIVQY